LILYSLIVPPTILFYLFILSNIFSFYFKEMEMRWFLVSILGGGTGEEAIMKWHVWRRRNTQTHAFVLFGWIWRKPDIIFTQLVFCVFLLGMMMMMMASAKSFTVSALPPFLQRPASSPFNVNNTGTYLLNIFVSFLFYFYFYFNWIAHQEQSFPNVY